MTAPLRGDNIKLTIDQHDVPVCTCGTGGRHWSIHDMATALGRPVAEADLIELWFTTREE